ncbi:MAG: hypothetical protein HKN47_05335 [Pirellulaceae bacterium]|nr:hypothetical protein [Pirellulaceae bacterium]
MSISTIGRYLIPATIALAVACVFTSTQAKAGIFGTQCLDQTGCCHRCPDCDYVCKFDAEQGETEKACFEVECKTICIPRVVFPWQMKNCKSCGACDGKGCSSCVNNGAKLRQIRVLKSKKYTCPECQYSWSAEKVERCGGCATGCGGCAGGASSVGCASAGCAEAPCDSPAGYAPMQPAATVAPRQWVPSTRMPARMPVPQG